MNNVTRALRRTTGKARGFSHAVILSTALFALFVGGCTAPNEKPAEKRETKASSSDMKVATIDKNDDLLEAGETFTTDVWNVTLNDGNITDSVDEVGNPYMVLKAEKDALYAIVNITFENITKETQPFSSIIDQFKISTDDGYSFSEDTMGRTALKQPFEDGDILPGKKRRGNIVFKVNDNIKNPVFEIRFTSVTARWKFYGEKTKDMTLKQLFLHD